MQATLTRTAASEEPSRVADEPGGRVKGYGPHLTYDGYGATEERLADMRVVFDFLLKMPEVIGMRRLTQPYVMFYDGGDTPEDYGVTGVVIIATSHISIHTYPHDGAFFLDVFSCKAFDQKKATAFIRKHFGAAREDVNLVTRGKRFREGQ